jgi:hypothetical protein
MSENKEIELLLKNLQNGLKRHSVSELNDAISIAINNKDDIKSDIDFILSLVAKDYGITIKAIKRNYARGKATDAKQIAYCLLHFNLGLSIRYIAKNVFHNWATSVFTGIKRFKNSDVKVKNDAEFIDRYKRLQEKVIKYLENKTKTK